MNQSQITQRIKEIKQELLSLGDLRPGSLSKQKRSSKKEYLQLSYTHQGKGHTEYVPVHRKEIVEEQIANHRRLRELTKEWVELGLALCKMKAQSQTKTETK